MRLILFCFLIPVFHIACGQKLLKMELGVSTGITKMDFFTGIQASTLGTCRIQYILSGEIGVNRTIFQKRIFPRISIGGAYAFLKKEKALIAAQVQYAVSLLKVNAFSSHMNNWNEIYGGLRMEFGKKLRLLTVFSAGWMNSRSYNTLQNQYTGINSLGYYGTVGLLYAW